MTLTIAFDNSYARLPGRFHARQTATPVAEPRLIALNRALAARLGLDADALASPEGIAVLAGNAVPDGAEPLAQVYAGHQFGGWVPQLGDGRALLLGEVIAPDGARFDLQLKGSGRTPFSRGGDGRAWLGPVLREYVVSEAMAALGLPTTRALAAVETGEPVWRDGFARPGAVLTRIAASHIRVGTFQYFAAQGDTEAVALLARHAIERHYPEASDALGLIAGVVTRQARLIAGWMSVGFIHGVMNTDNMTVSGETIDYGPCAFMDTYRPDKVFSSIDAGGRYAWANQPQVALWNLAQLASALLPLISPDQEAAIEAATEVVNRFAAIYQAEWTRRFGRKIGLAEAGEDDLPLIQGLLGAMARNEADFTRCFHGLSDGTARDTFIDPTAFDAWAVDWQARLAREADPVATMQSANPVRIPRNHRIEQAIAAALEGDFAPFHALNAALAAPYSHVEGTEWLEAAPKPEEIVARTFCGT
uniref:protein adenylyltransferase SelO n=1 Tax=Paenirhodobacter enshiensis TaxID=1105367 RepID=UPI0035B10877